MKAKGFPVHSSGSVEADLGMVSPCWPVVCSLVWFLMRGLQLPNENQPYSPWFPGASAHGAGEPSLGGVWVCLGGDFPTIYMSTKPGIRNTK